MRGARGRIGFLFPDDGLNDDEYWAWLPEGVAWLTTRYPGTLPGRGLDRATFEASADPGPMAQAARLFRPARVGVAATGDHAGSFVLGPAHEARMAEAIRAGAGAVAGVTPSGALVEALRALGARRVAVVSPYDAEVTAAGVAFLEAHGMVVVSTLRRAFGDEHAIAGQEAAFWAEAAVEADRPEAEALALMGGGIRMAGALAGLEARLGKPAVPATAALVWRACALLGAVEPRPHLGRLFGPPPPAPDPGPPPAPEIGASLRRRMSAGTKTFALTDDPPVFVGGEGSRLIGADGRRRLDFACGSGTTVLGHGDPAVARAVSAQMATGLSHVGPHFHAPVQIALMERLCALTGLDRLHPATTGGEATEAALKAAMHATGGRRFVAFEGGYHGRTFGALAVSHAKGANAALGADAPAAVFLPWPERAGDLPALEAALDAALAAPGAAGVIAEPAQATAGMRTAPDGFLPLLRRAADRRGAALILDEVFTGFGRTGSLFAFQAAGVLPDLLILGKAAGGGLPGAMVLGRGDWLARWPQGAQSSTFQLHPAAAAASLATLEALVARDLPRRAAAIGRRLRARVAPLGPVLGTGAMLGLAIRDAAGRPDRERTRAIRRAALGLGLVTWECGLSGEVIGLVPPLTASDGEIDEACAILAEALRRAR